LSRPARYGFPTHKQCNNFRSGICLLSGISVYPDGPVCPNFTPKIMTDTTRISPAPDRPSLKTYTSPITPLPRPQPTPYLPQQFIYSPKYAPSPWEVYNNPLCLAYPPSFMYPWIQFGYGMTPWYGVPFTQTEYGYQTSGYGYPSYYSFPFQMFPQSFNEELKMLDAYRRELQAEIESVNTRIIELRGRISAIGRG
jgi:hypothetical protein